MKLERTTKFTKQFSELLRDNPRLAEKVGRMLKNIVAPRGLFNFNKGEKMKYSPNRYSARIDRKNRLVYDLYEDLIVLISCRGHYEDK